MIRVGIGGWTYPPWRGSFYPTGLVQARELEHASRQLGAIEINATFHGPQKPASFAKWRDGTSEGFVFSVKASRHATHRRVLADAGEAIQHFLAGGLVELGAKLGPIVWQFAPYQRFDADDFGAFLRLLPAQFEGLPLCHVMDVRHPSFGCADYIRLARRHAVATVYSDAPGRSSIADPTGEPVYARLMGCQADEPSGYTPEALDRWAACARTWRNGGVPAELPLLDGPIEPGPPREVLVFFINGAKERAPAAALALQQRLTGAAA